MKLACADFSFPLLPHESVLDLIAAFDVEGLDLAVMGNRSHIRPEDVRGDLKGAGERIRASLEQRGLVVADFFVIPWTDFETMAPNHPDATVRVESRALFDDMLQLAADVGASGMTFLPGIHWQDETWDASFARAAEEMAWRVEQARARGMRFSIEAHLGSIVDTPEKALALVDAAPGLELTLDYTHFVFQGIPASEIEPLIAHSRHFHARAANDHALQTTLRENTIDYDRVVDLLLDSGYDGFIGIEYVWTPGDPPGSAYDMTNTDNVAETILLRDQIRGRLTQRAA